MSESAGRWVGWALAIVGLAGAAGLGLLLVPILGPHILAPFLLVIAAASLVGGLGPGLFAVAASGVAVNYWFFPPSDRLGFTDQPDFIAQLIFWAVALLIAAVCAWSRARRLRAEGETKQASTELQAMRVRLTTREPERAEPRIPVRKEPRTKVPREILPQSTALVASEDAEARQLACHALESMGFRWLSACDATEALELVDRYDFPVEVALIDVLLPDMRGESLAERLIARHANTAVLYTSNVPHDELVSRGLLPIRESLVPQPFTAEQLVSAVRDLVGGRTDTQPTEVLVVSSGDR
jgi:CheY-like chemotaxis protein